MLKLRQSREERRNPSQRLKPVGNIVAEQPRSGSSGAAGIEVERVQMALDVTYCFELKKLFLLDANSETGVGFNQDFVKPQGVDSDIFHQPGIRGDHRRISTGDSMKDLYEASLQLLIIGNSLSQHHQSFDPAKVPVFLRLPIAPVPAELLVDGLMVNLDEEGEAILRQA